MDLDMGLVGMVDMGLGVDLDKGDVEMDMKV
jgi:hypothetical protein